jgi:hypothetical protein
VKLALLIIVTVVATTFVSATAADSQYYPKTTTVEGKTVHWWAARAKQARKDANARAVTIKRLRDTLTHDPSISECVRLATIAYPDFSEDRAWAIIHHESWMTSDPLHARNPRSTASGLFQFLTSTWRSTPYGRAGISIWSACGQALAAGWMHANGRGGEWALG